MTTATSPEAPSPAPAAAAPQAAAPAAAAPQAAAPAAAAPQAAAPVEHDYKDVKLAKDAASNADMAERVKAYAKENSLNPEQAQRLLDSMSGEVKTFTEAKSAEWQTMTQAWVDDVKADKEIGGVQFDANTKLANKVVHKFATPEFISLLDETGFGNHPELIRLLARIGKTMKEDSFILPGASSGAPVLDKASKLYDNPTSN